MRYLTKNEVMAMDDSKVVYVSRIAIEQRLMQLNQQNKGNTEAVRILCSAMREMRIRERKSKTSTAVFGPRMTVKDVRRAFDKFTNLPKNDFREILRQEN